MNNLKLYLYFTILIILGQYKAVKQALERIKEIALLKPKILIREKTDKISVLEDMRDKEIEEAGYYYDSKGYHYDMRNSITIWEHRNIVYNHYHKWISEIQEEI